MARIHEPREQLVSTSKYEKKLKSLLIEKFDTNTRDSRAFYTLRINPTLSMKLD